MLFMKFSQKLSVTPVLSLSLQLSLPFFKPPFLIPLFYNRLLYNIWLLCMLLVSVEIRVIFLWNPIVDPLFSVESDEFPGEFFPVNVWIKATNELVKSIDFIQIRLGVAYLFRFWFNQFFFFISAAFSNKTHFRFPFAFPYNRVSFKALLSDTGVSFVDYRRT